MPETHTTNGSTPASESKPASKPARKPARKPASKPARTATLAKTATTVETHKRRPVFKDVPNIPRVAMADGRIGAVQAEVMLEPDGTTVQGAHMLTVVRRNADGTESGQRFPLADVQLLADAFASAGFKLV